jgi:hypothetical protein
MAIRVHGNRTRPTGMEQARKTRNRTEAEKWRNKRKPDSRKKTTPSNPRKPASARPRPPLPGPAPRSGTGRGRHRPPPRSRPAPTEPRRTDSSRSAPSISGRRSVGSNDEIDPRKAAQRSGMRMAETTLRMAFAKSLGEGEEPFHGDSILIAKNIPLFHAARSKNMPWKSRDLRLLSHFPEPHQAEKSTGTIKNFSGSNVFCDPTGRFGERSSRRRHPRRGKNFRQPANS